MTQSLVACTVSKVGHVLPKHNTFQRLMLIVLNILKKLYGKNLAPSILFSLHKLLWLYHTYEETFFFSPGKEGVKSRMVTSLSSAKG